MSLINLPSNLPSDNVPDYEDRKRVYSSASKAKEEAKRRPTSSAFQTSKYNVLITNMLSVLCECACDAHGGVHVVAVN